MLNRRKFLKIAGALGLLPLVAQPQTVGNNKDKKAFRKDQIRVLQGATNAISTIITVLSHRDVKVQFNVIDKENKQHPYFAADTIDMRLGDFVVHQLYITNLSPESNYELLIENKTHNHTHIKKFKSLDWQRSDAKVAVLSCSNHRDAKAKTKMFLQLNKANPDLILFIGDLVYANSSLDTIFDRPASVEDAYGIYTKTLMEFELYDQEKLIPIFAGWDDHDLAYNNSDTFNPNKETMHKMFRTFFPADDRVEGLMQGPGTSFAIEAFGVQIVMLDTRYFKNSDAEQFLGQNQLSWLDQVCKFSKSPILLLSAQQFWNYRILTESYQGDSAIEFNELLRLIKHWAAPVVFVSGDVHYSHIQNISESILGYRTYEITSSAFFSSSAGVFGKRSIKDGQYHYYGYPNFILLDRIKSNSRSLLMKATCISEDNTNQFSREMIISRRV